MPKALRVAQIGLHRATGLCYQERPAPAACRGVGDCPAHIRPTPRAGAAAGPERSVKAKVLVQVRDNNVDQALRVLKKKLQREGVFREMKLRRSFEKPSARKKRERAEAVRRHRKLLRKRMDREGF